jgi:parvulin-like peptidyl-prolyl isomerase
MRRTRRSLGFLGMALAPLLACRDAGGPDPVILALDDQIVRRSEFERHVAGLEAQGGERLSAEVLPSVLDTYLEERVLVLRARARGLVTSGASPAEEQQAVQRLLASEVLGDLQVSRTEVIAYYERHPEEFEVQETVSLRQILVANENEARDVLRRLHKDPRGFEALARSLSKGPEGPAGGVMGVFSPGQLPPDLEAPAFALPAGGMSGVVRTPLGYHILRVDERTAARRLSIDDAESRIRATLLRESSDRKVRRFVSELLARAKVNHAAAHLRR